ncbi:site-specific recombinase phage integrase family [Bacteroides sp. CAG:714]|jgi:hypothetical protein|nr:site-specific recombinase phage integrase family [Bacteroides sp. CAG:714]
MATLKLTIIPEKAAKDGSHKIRVAIGHKSVTRYIVTNIKIDSVSQFKNGQIVKRPDASVLNTKLRNLLNAYQEKLDNIGNISIYDCKQLRQLLLNSTSSDEKATFQAVCRKYISELEEEGRRNYSILLERNCRYFTEYTKGEILLSDITPILIEGYARFLKVKKGIGDTTLGMMMSRTRTIINRGVKQQLAKYDVHPFLNYSIPSSPVREVDISLEAFNRIRLAAPKEKKYRVAHDLFCLSFYLGGINLIDLLQIDFRDTDVLEYVRTKTRNTAVGTRTICFTIPEPAKEIIKEWMNRNTGRLDFGYKFSYPNFSRYLTRSLASLAKELGITEKVVYYSARKSFAQYASEIGIPDGIIDYCLGHSDKSKGVIRYYTKVRQKQADMAISRVIDYVDNPEKYKEYIGMRQDFMMMMG